MAEQFGVDAAKLAGAGTKTAELVSRVDSISAKASGAIVPAVSWGLIGQPIAWTIYRSMMDDFADFMTDLAEGVEQAGKHLADSAETYRGIDTAINEVFTRIHQPEVGR